MVRINIPITLTKVSTIDKDLREIIKPSNINFSESPIGDPSNKKYACLDKKGGYAVMVSKNLKRVSPVYGYNFILAITSYSNEQNEKIANDFQDETGVELKKAPKSLEKIMNKISKVWARIS